MDTKTIEKIVILNILKFFVTEKLFFFKYFINSKIEAIYYLSPKFTTKGYYLIITTTGILHSHIDLITYYYCITSTIIVLVK